MGLNHLQSHGKLDKKLQQNSWNKLQQHAGQHTDIYSFLWHILVTDEN